MNEASNQALEERSRRQAGQTRRKSKQESDSSTAEKLFEGLSSLDTEKATGLYSVFSPADFRGLIEMVYKCVETEMVSVESALERHDVGAAMIAAHKITGSSGNYALSSVSKSAARLSDALGNGVEADVANALLDLRSDSQEAIADLETVLTRLAD